MANILLPLGRTLITPGAQELLMGQGVEPTALLQRHEAGDWGELDDEDKAANDHAAREGDRVLSAYDVGPDARVWVITEWDRSATTVLLPSEY